MSTVKAKQSISINESAFDAISSLSTVQLIHQDITNLFNGLSQSLQQVRKLEIEAATVLRLRVLRYELVIWTHELTETIKAGELYKVTRQVAY